MPFQFPDVASEFIYMRTYSRWIDELGRRETWEETVDRYIDFIQKHCGNVVPQKVFRKAREAILNMRAMPSMRALWTAGPAAEFDNTCLYNCFSKDTLFISSKGVVSFANFSDGEEIQVITHNGRWKNATVRSFGRQVLNRVYFAKGGRGKDHVVNVTANHKWILKSGENTTNLKEGDLVLMAPKKDDFIYENATPDERLYWCYGYVYGDGTKVKGKSDQYEYSMVRLCKKDVPYSVRFEEVGFKTSTNHSLNGDFFAYTGTYLKTLPEIEKEPIERIMAFLNGYLCADGAKEENNGRKYFKAIQATGNESINFLRKTLPMCGYYIVREDDFTGQITNFGQRTDKTISFSISDNICRESNAAWRVSRIEQNISEEEVWCLEVEGDHSFCLPFGVVTGNCSFQNIDSVEAFAECLYILMCGAGYGFSVEKKYVDKLPEVPKLTSESSGTYIIEDNKMGWAESVRRLMTALYNGKDLDLDYSKLRPKGARLKTMGGRSSGPEPLMRLHTFIREVFQKAQGRKLKSIECHDICNQIAEIVVVGGVRRSSEISISDLDDLEMANAKTGTFPVRRYMSNNSAVYYEKPTAARFLREWSILVNSGTGERGIFNLAGARKNAPERRNGKMIDGTNPCGEINLRSRQFCVAGNTQVITKNGIITIKDAVGEEHEVWNGKKWSKVIPRLTRKNASLVRVELSDGSYLECTPDHRFSVKNRFSDTFLEVQAKDLMLHSKYKLQSEPYKIQYENGSDFQNAYTLGFAVGDGCVYKNKVFIDLYGEKDFLCPVEGNRYKKYLPAGYSKERQRVNCTNILDGNMVSALKTSNDAFIPIFSWSKKSILEFLAGMIDADGSETSTGGIRLYLSDRERSEKIQLLLTKCGIRSSICLLQKAGEITNIGERRRDLFYLQITDCSEIPCKRVNTYRGHISIIKSKYQNIKSVTEIDGVNDVYCFEEKERHMAVFNNILTYQCNLSEIVLRDGDDLDDIMDKVETTVWLGAIQSTFTYFPYLNKKWKTNCEEECLLGVSITGQMDNPGLLTETALEALKKKAIKIAKHASSILGINLSVAITCVKPSGTVSQLVNSSSGLHPRYSKYYIRRYRISSTDPLYKMMNDQGFKFNPDNGQRQKDWRAAAKGNTSACSIYEQGKEWSEDKVTTWVVEFPVKSPEKSTIRNEMTAIDQLEHYRKIQTKWCEHNASCTVYVKDEEWIEVGNWVYKNWDIINGISFLPHDGGNYEQAPYEEINKETYDKMIKDIPKIDYNKLSNYEKEDSTTGAKSLACVGDKCEIS